ncbi:hypothetical protein KRX54_00065 [Actinomycetaceae bacterium TAE3-ERU4]|nr:hypothetical protein [Actinomycetaceae bacterium TAE3-ERU4]
MKSHSKQNVTSFLYLPICLITIITYGMVGAGDIYDRLAVLGLACLVCSGLFYITPAWYLAPMFIITWYGWLAFIPLGIKAIQLHWLLVMLVLIAFLYRPGSYFQIKRYKKYKHLWNDKHSQPFLKQFKYFSYAWFCCIAQAYIFGILTYRNAIISNLILSVISGCFVGIIIALCFGYLRWFISLLGIPAIATILGVGFSNYFYLVPVLAFGWLSSYLTACIIGESSTRYEYP